MKKGVYIKTGSEFQLSLLLEKFKDEFLNRSLSIRQLKRCSKCILPSTFPGIDIDSLGVCNFCRNYEAVPLKGETKLKDLIDKIGAKKGEFDALIPFSGGRDSSFLLHFLKRELGLNPIAFSYDWGMMTDLARRNQSRLCGSLGIKHIVISADLRKKRENIRKNVVAWLKKPHLGMIPLFTAGDKHYFYYVNKLMKAYNISVVFMGENRFERTDFKTAFTGGRQKNSGYMAYDIDLLNKVKLISFYLGQFLINPKYLNLSLADTIIAFISFYLSPRKYENLYDYIKWDEELINRIITEEYGWETDPGTLSTWRIGDGTAAFYNYIYYMVAGFTENDTFRSNQIREGVLSRGEAIKKSEIENQPRWESIRWYCDTIQINFEDTIEAINKIKKLY
ncbi:MAG: hypothetical protein IFNCLDLE_02343 [Ignavibacteriaceae bacterium]|nr:hypothetical protein [Ignavibacteriaceae bacterium]OQY79715.1 MAG: hypothetical protein B6D45_00370 [Ignavibacteriales bacterium UTCHB3]